MSMNLITDFLVVCFCVFVGGLVLKMAIIHYRRGKLYTFGVDCFAILLMAAVVVAIVVGNFIG